VAKERGTAQFTLKDVVAEINEKEGGEEDAIRYGVIIDDGDNIREE
jgi:hypothetical protein